MSCKKLAIVTHFHFAAIFKAILWAKMENLGLIFSSNVTINLGI